MSEKEVRTSLQVSIWGRRFQAKGTAHAKARGQSHALHVRRAVRRPVWLEQSEQLGEREEMRVGRRQGRLCSTLWAEGRTWSFTPRE